MSVLVLAPHADDAEFGCGGTIARYIEEGKTVYVWAFSLAEKVIPVSMPSDIRIQEMGHAMKVLGVTEYWHEGVSCWHRNMTPYRQDILDRMVALNRSLTPSEVFIPSTDDVHQDHQVITQEAMRAFKQCSLYGYEMPWNNMTSNHRMFVKLAEVHLEKKIEAISKYKSANNVRYRDESFLRGLATVRGVQAGSLYAESFEVIRRVE
jgi:LmbE family N-acetylglucosaminyl deacetylase